MQLVEFYTSCEGSRGVAALPERMHSVVVPGVHVKVWSVQGVQIALLEPRALQELDSTKLHKMSRLIKFINCVFLKLHLSSH